MTGAAEHAGLVRSEAVMGTVTTIEVRAASDHAAAPAALDRAFAWFHAVEQCCSRFEPESELVRLCASPGNPVTVSAMLFEALQLAIAVATETDGAFDPTVGGVMVARGFDREHRSGRQAPPLAADRAARYNDILLDPVNRTVLLRRPLVLDLGAVAKGLAIDLAARELQPLTHYAIDAGGDLYLAGLNALDEPWSVAIRDPHSEGTLETIRVSGRAVCTSGDYQRISPVDGGSHLIDPRIDAPAAGVASATVIAPSAMLADAVATAAMVLDPREGIDLCTRLGLDAVIVTAAGGQLRTRHTSDA